MPYVSALFATAQTNTPLVAVDIDERLTITRVSVTLDNATSADVGVALLFDNTVFAGHPCIAAGSGFIESYKPGEVEGGLGKPLLFTCEEPTTGSLRVSVSYLLYRFRS